MAVRATRVTATGTVLAGKGRVVGVSLVCGATAGSIVLRDNGAGGTTRLELDTAAGATLTRDVPIKGGIHFGTDIHATLTNVTSLTVFYDTDG